LGVGGFEGHGVCGASRSERTVERGRAEISSKLDKDTEYVL
jgi:hypothetical protein